MDPQNALTNWGPRSETPPVHILHDQHNRLAALRADAGDWRDRIERLVELSKRGLPQMYSDGTFVQTVRAIKVGSDTVIRPEGTNLRYAAIVALGASHVDEPAQRRILGGNLASEYALSLLDKAKDSDDTGSLALVAWAAAEISGTFANELFERMSRQVSTGAPISTVECSWVLTAAIAARGLADVDDLCLSTGELLKRGQGQFGLFPHMLPAVASGRFREHVGCFADQVYPIQALARFSVAFGDEAALVAANECAARICELQGPSGQWWWHYDTRDGRVVEGYPVYSVHQHAMAPMALLDLHEAGGTDYRREIIKGLTWLEDHPEVSDELVSAQWNVVWRKVGRREPKKGVRSLSAFTTSLRPGLHVPGLDAVFPPTQIDHECRPYELGWLLYAWLSGGVVEKLAGTDYATAALATRPSEAQSKRQLLFGLHLDPLPMKAVLDRCREALETRTSLLLGVLNAAKVVKLRKDAALRASLLECDLLLADGQSVVWASRILGQPLPERVAGIDVFEELLGLAHREKRSVYLLGARPDVLKALVARLETRFPGLRIAGSHDGYFSDADGAKIAADIEQSGADMLFLGMGSPKKEIFLGAYKNDLNVPILHGVGGSFDVLAGITKRAPVAWQRAGMEWAYRLLQEPRRMFGRYLTTNTEFVFLVMREVFHPSPPFRSVSRIVPLRRFDQRVFGSRLSPDLREPLQ